MVAVAEALGWGSSAEGAALLQRAWPLLVREYGFWMGGGEGGDGGGVHSVVLDGKHVLNRYGSGEISPRPESYREDVDTATAAATGAGATAGGGGGGGGAEAEAEYLLYPHDPASLHLYTEVGIY